MQGLVLTKDPPPHISSPPPRKNNDEDALVASSFGRLSHDLILQIISNLHSVQDVVHIGLTCKAVHKISENDAHWKSLFQSRFPYCDAIKGYSDLFRQFTTVEKNIRLGIYRQQTFPHHDAIDSIQVSENRLYTISSDKTAHTWNIESGECLQTFRFDYPESSCNRYQLVEGRLYVSSLDGAIWVWDIALGKNIKTLEGHDLPISCFHVDGNRLITGSWDHTVKVWDIQSGRCERTLTGHNNKISCIHFANGRVFTGAFCSTIKIWDVESGECLQTITDNGNEIRCLHFAGNYLFAGLWHETIKVWDVQSGDCLCTFEGDDGDHINCLQVVGNLLYYTGSWDNAIKIWNIELGKCILKLKGHTGWINCMQIKMGCLYTGSDDGSAKLWNFNIPCAATYTLKLLEENLAILNEIVLHSQNLEHQISDHLLEKLYPGFEQRLHEIFRASKTASSLSKEMIIQLQSEMYVEILLHAIYTEDEEKIEATLRQLKAISDNHTTLLYQFLQEECGVSLGLRWGERAFKDTIGKCASNLRKIRAVLRLREVLNGSPFDPYLMQASKTARCLIS